MCLDVFHPWPRDALVGVAERFMEVLQEKNIQNEEGSDARRAGVKRSVSQEVLASIAQHSAEVHVSVYKARKSQSGNPEIRKSDSLNLAQANQRYLDEERRYNSTTPKSFLELISFYVTLHVVDLGCAKHGRNGTASAGKKLLALRMWFTVCIQ